jgi:hypothetical protein
MATTRRGVSSSRSIETLRIELYPAVGVNANIIGWLAEAGQAASLYRRLLPTNG